MLNQEYIPQPTPGHRNLILTFPIKPEVSVNKLKTRQKIGIEQTNTNT